MKLLGKDKEIFWSFCCAICNTLGIKTSVAIEEKTGTLGNVVFTHNNSFVGVVPFLAMNSSETENTYKYHTPTNINEQMDIKIAEYKNFIISIIHSSCRYDKETYYKLLEEANLKRTATPSEYAETVVNLAIKNYNIVW